MSEENYSLSGRVFHDIREKILSGAYHDGDELKEKAIGDELGVSRTPVREALRQLELEGLIEIIPNRGAFVVGINMDDIKDIYEMRSRLEGLCAKKAAQNITADQLSALEENVYLSDFHFSKGHFEQIWELDNHFHEILYEASGSKIIKKTLSDFHHYLERIRKITLSSSTRAAHSIEEHRQIVAAIKDHDADAADRLAHVHISNTILNLETQGLENLLTGKVEQKWTK